MISISHPSKILNGKNIIGNSDARLGFEPKLTPSKGVVLPLHHQAILVGAAGLEPANSKEE